MKRQEEGSSGSSSSREDENLEDHSSPDITYYMKNEEITTQIPNLTTSRVKLLCSELFLFPQVRAQSNVDVFEMNEKLKVA